MNINLQCWVRCEWVGCSRIRVQTQCHVSRVIQNNPMSRYWSVVWQTGCSFWCNRWHRYTNVEINALRVSVATSKKSIFSTYTYLLKIYINIYFHPYYSIYVAFQLLFLIIFYSFISLPHVVVCSLFFLIMVLHIWKNVLLYFLENNWMWVFMSLHSTEKFSLLKTPHI